MAKKQFSRILFALLIYTLLVILWGAWVRISHSGDGCGDTWPLCNGKIIPEAEQGKTWVEYSHRMMSGIFGLLIIALYFKVKSLFPKNHPARFWALLSLIFTITEAALGAKLVLFGLVSSNDSPYRAFVMGLHLINSLMLTASIALTWNFSKSSDWKKRINAPWNMTKFTVQRAIISSLVAFLMIAITGALAALSNTLFPTASLVDGFAADWDSNSHFLIRLRGFHPIAGILLGGSLAVMAWLSVQMAKTEETIFKNRSLFLAVVTSVAIAFGIATLLSLAPIWMKIVHLLLAHTVWIGLVLWISSLRWGDTRQPA